MASPFFEPIPQPEPDDEPGMGVPPVFPGQPAWNVDRQIVALNLDIARTDTLVLRLTHVEAQRAGLTLCLRWWSNPHHYRGLPSHRAWQPGQEQPRLGVRLTDGSTFGSAWNEHVDVFDSAPGLSPAEWQSEDTGGHAQFYLRPVPEGDHLDVVVAWQDRDVPETWVRLDLHPLREAAAASSTLWPGPSDEELSHGWFAYAPMSGATYVPDPPDAADGSRHERPDSATDDS